MNDIYWKAEASELTLVCGDKSGKLVDGGALDKLFDDDWNAIEGGFDNYYFGYDGGGFASYDR